MKSFVRLALAAGIAGGSVDVAAAATATATMGVEVKIEQSCTIVTTNPKLTFPTVGGFTANNDATATFQVNCNQGTPYQIGLGAGSGGSVTTRKMVGAVPAGGGAAPTVNYGLFRDATRAAGVNWGSTSGTDTVGGTGSGAAQTITVFGRIPVQTAPVAGLYSDNIVITLFY